MNDLCPHCRYSLSGLPANARCPECGKSRYHTAPTPNTSRPRTEPPPPDRVLTKNGVRIETPAPPAHATAAQPQSTKFDRQFIGDHVKCGGCGYDLYGLRVGNPCPECARIILPSIARAGSSNLVEAPIPYIKKLMLGFALMAMGVTTLAMSLALLAGPRPSSYTLGGTYNMAVPALRFKAFVAPQIGAALIVAAAAMWFVGVFIVSGPRPVIEKPSPVREALWRRLAWASRATQACLVAAPCVLIAGSLLAPTIPIASSIALWLAIALLAAALIGWWPTGRLTSEIADWACDTDLSRHIGYAVYGMGVCTLLILLGHMLPLQFGGFMFRLWSWMLFALGIGCLGAFLFSTFKLARLMADAAWIAKGMQARDRRMIEKMNKEREAHRQRVDSAPAEHEPDLTRKIATVPQQPQRPR